MNWVKCTDRLPKPLPGLTSILVLAYWGCNNFDLVHFSPPDRWFFVEGGCEFEIEPHLNPPTYWMPLKPPEE